MSVPFSSRHIGPRETEIQEMLKSVKAADFGAFLRETVPNSIFDPSPLDLPLPASEHDATLELQKIAQQNRVLRSFIGMGYSETLTPAPIRRSIFENPGWYTQYTPYQAEIAHGRLEALLNFQTVITELTGMEIANASLLDEGTAAAEAVMMASRIIGGNRQQVVVSEKLHPQTIDVIQTRSDALGLKVVRFDGRNEPELSDAVAIVVGYPETDGEIFSAKQLCSAAKAAGAFAIVCADLLALCLLEAPGVWGADVVVGSAQRFGVPLGFGGPHAAFFATKDEYKRQMPGRLVGVSKDAAGNRGYRLALQTREQHIRREKATSNICTAQVLLAVMAGMYAVYHGPDGLRAIAKDIHQQAVGLKTALVAAGVKVLTTNFFDTVRFRSKDARTLKRAEAAGILLRDFGDGTFGASIGEGCSEADLLNVISVITGAKPKAFAHSGENALGGLDRKSDYLSQPVFHEHRTETSLLRYIRKLESRDLSLTTSMIPLGSCTMKLNAASEMFPVSWPEFSALHPFAPAEFTAGYQRLCSDLESWLCTITGLDACSLQPNAGSQGEYAGLLAIRNFLAAQGQKKRNKCLIPESAHGTNPASAIMAGFEVVTVKCDAVGNVDIGDLKEKLDKHSSSVAALMVTYPSTHGVFESGIREICSLVHAKGAQVYMDGANLNAQVGLCRAGDFGIDVCHINLHKTFCIPHGGGGPGVGPICVKQHLEPFLPGTPGELSRSSGSGPVSAAPQGSASILVIPWMYIRMMGGEGLKLATSVAILNANYIVSRLEKHFDVLYRGENGRVAHECILDVRFAKDYGIEVEDVAKRLMDYGFHAPTVSWPVPGTIMIEPTESESKAELDRFCDAMIQIHGEIMAVKRGDYPVAQSPLKNAPHTAEMVTSTEWSLPYSRETAAFPAPWTKEHKFWPAVRRVDNVYGDRNLFCTCG